ncbi:MAG: hypothetical protein WDO24_09820 [Pseudomonadota bacterium]
MTFRNNASQTALPVRSWGVVHAAQRRGRRRRSLECRDLRFLPSDFQLRSHLTQRYGAKFLPTT